MKRPSCDIEDHCNLSIKLYLIIHDDDLNPCLLTDEACISRWLISISQYQHDGMCLIGINTISQLTDRTDKRALSLAGKYRGENA